MSLASTAPPRGLWHPIPHQAETIRSGSSQGQTPPTHPQEQSQSRLKTEPPAKKQKAGAGRHRLNPEQGPDSITHRGEPAQTLPFPEPQLPHLKNGSPHGAATKSPEESCRGRARSGHASAPAASACIHGRPHAASPRVGPRAFWGAWRLLVRTEAFLPGQWSER